MSNLILKLYLFEINFIQTVKILVTSLSITVNQVLSKVYFILTITTLYLIKLFKMSCTSV